MPARYSRFDYGGRVKRRQKLKIIVSVGVAALVVAGFALFWGNKNAFGNSGSDYKELTRLWHDGLYLAAFDASERDLEQKPMDFFLLMIHGFSAYQIGIAQIDTFNMLSYIDRSIWALRKAQLTKQGEHDMRIKYALGRAYYYKGPAYADLCVRYLEEARNASYKADDIPQFLGLAYASIRDFEQSVAAFTEALAPDGAGSDTSDVLLLAIARSYMELGDTTQARPYIMRTIELSKDWNAVSAARLLLAALMTGEGDLSGAEKQIRMVLAEGGENAEARFRLGVLYELQNDYYRARAEWRRAFNLDPGYAPLREKNL